MLFLDTADSPVQIDEAFFSGRRKYWRVRILLGDPARHAIANEDDSDCEPNILNDSNPDWRWVLGIYFSSTQIRFFRIKDRKKSTIIPLIQKCVVPGSVIWTDEFSSYKHLGDIGYSHATMNHSKHFISPITQEHTQGIERASMDAKRWTKKCTNNRKLLLGHLDEVSWRKLRSSITNQVALFKALLEDMCRTFGVV